MVDFVLCEMKFFKVENVLDIFVYLNDGVVMSEVIFDEAVVNISFKCGEGEAFDNIKLAFTAREVFTKLSCVTSPLKIEFIVVLSLVTYVVGCKMFPDEQF